jgi:hypothetical protein
MEAPWLVEDWIWACVYAGRLRATVGAGQISLRSAPRGQVYRLAATDLAVSKITLI